MATTTNIFRGDGKETLLALKVYDILRRGKVCTYKDFLKEYYGEKWDPKTNVSSYPEYNTALKPAVKKVLEEIKKVMGEESIRKTGGTRNRTFQYVGDDPDPLGLLRDSKTKGIEEYLEFCRDSAGFIPEQLLQHFLKDSIALYDIHWDKKRSTQGVLMSHNKDLTNLEMLPAIYDAIKNKTALKIVYQPFEGESRIEWLSPHFIREFNGRWYVSGFRGRSGTIPFNLPLDRIVKFDLVEGQYREAPVNLYREWFADIIGIARYKEATLEEVIIRTYSEYVHGLVNTKPFHHSQEEIKPYAQHEDGTYGEISLKVLINPEGKNKQLRGKLLAYGSELEVMSPIRFRQEVANEARKLWEAYSV